MNQATFSVGILDDHPMISSGVTTILNQVSEIEVVFAVENKTALFNSLEQGLPDVLIMDIVVPNVSGIDLFKEVLAKYPDLSIVAYSTLKSKLLLKTLITCGVKGYVNKRQPSLALIDAIKQVHTGEHYLPEEYATLLTPQKDTPEPFDLSAREKETLQLILHGLLTKEIADQLDISSSTVEKFRASLFKKFKVQNVAELISAATQLGFVKEQ